TADAAVKPAGQSIGALEQAEEKRRQAEALVAKLASALKGELPRIEQELTAIGQAAMVPLKLAELSDNFEVRRRATLIAGRLRWRLVCPPDLMKAHPDLVAVMSGRDNEARATLVDRIAKTARAPALAFLGECLADPQIYVRQRAIDGLVHVARSDSRISRGAQKKVSELLDMALRDDDRNIRLLAVGAMAKIRAVEPARLAEMLDDDSVEVRTTVIRAMGFSRNFQAVKYIKPLLKDPQWRIRAAALEALAQLVSSSQASSVATEVLKRLDDEDNYVRELAAKILGDWRYSKAAQELLELIKAKTISEEAGFRALAAMKDAPAKKELLARYDSSEDPARKTELLSFMNDYDPDFAVDSRLKKALTDASMKSQWPQLISQAGRRDRWEPFFPHICKYLTHEDDAVSEAAWEVVRYRSDEKPLPKEVTRRLLDSDNPQWATGALTAAYRYNGRDYPKVLDLSLKSPKGELVALALGMIGKEYVGDSLVAEVPAYRRT
ncbi:MAG: HEAT repeat domain-containing protein, partial [Planctomycetia bacterium]|nr:HEAT repeat domain-containing protein [Planctomycetia bacterium]